MGYITTYGNGLLLNTVFTRDVINYSLPSNFQLALLNVQPERNTIETDLVEPATGITGSTFINGADYYNVSGGTYITYSINPANAMEVSFEADQSVTISGINATFNLSGITKDTILTNTNTILTWNAATAYAVGNVATVTSGNVTLYYSRLVAGTTATTPRNDTTNWAFIPLCNYNQFTIFVTSTISTSFTSSGTYGTVIANTGYSRINTGIGDANWTFGQGSIYNANEIIFSTPYTDWGIISGWALLDVVEGAITSAAYVSATSAIFTVNLTSQIFAIGQTIIVSNVTGGNYNQTVTITGVGGTSGAFTFTATGTGFTSTAGTGGTYKKETQNVLACGNLQQILFISKNSLVSMPAGSIRLYLN